MSLVTSFALAALAQDPSAIQDQEAPHKHESAVPS
jgi:hypothetical protein